MTDILNHAGATPWIDYVDGKGAVATYRCHPCKSFAGKLKSRHVYEKNGGEHREYKVECEVCGHTSGVYWSRTLAEKTWEAESDPYYEKIIQVGKGGAVDGKGLKVRPVR